MKYGDCDYVYNIILNRVKTIIINGITALGHGFDGRDLGEFFGILDGLICGCALRNWSHLKRDGFCLGNY